MPEKSAPEIDPLLHSLNLFHKGFAYVGASQYSIEEIGMDPEEIAKFGYGWEDGYYVTIKHFTGDPPWKKFFGMQKTETYEWIHINAPINPEEKINARHIAGDRIGLMLGKIAGRMFLISPDINRTLWWKTSTGKDFHSTSDHFPKTLQDILTHLSTSNEEQMPKISFLYLPLPHSKGDVSPKYERKPFILPSENIKGYLAMMRSAYDSV